MRYVKIGAIHIPPEAGSRSRWASQMLEVSLSAGLAPLPVPDALLTRFTVCLPDALADRLQGAADELGLSVALTAAMHIAAAQRADTPAPAKADAQAVTHLVGEDSVREILRPLLHRAWTAIRSGKIALVEAATGTGKGRLAASLAASAARDGDVTVVAAPLAVLHQLVFELRAIQTDLKPLLLLGRANFVDPERLQELLEDEDHPALQSWVEGGGIPRSSPFQTLSDALKVPLRWLAEEAQSLDDTVDIGNYLLDESADVENPGEIAYKAAFRALSEANGSREGTLVMCSHLMLAVDSRLKSFGADQAHGILPAKIDTLLVDEAHLLESAFASVHASTVHLFALERRIREAELPAATRSAMENALEDLIRTGEVLLKEERSLTGSLASLPLLETKLQALSGLIRDALGRKTRKELSPKTRAARIALTYARETMERGLSGYTVIHLNTTPVRRHLLLTCGRNNLDRFFERMWENVGGSALISATLYTPDASGQQSAGHMRWVMSVPKGRAAYFAPVIPAWVTSTADVVQLQSAIAPDDSDDWLDQTASQLEQVYLAAKGGTLALCTSYATVEALSARLKQQYPHVLAQSTSNSAARCAQMFRHQAASGIKPLWLGVGAAWTGIDLADKEATAERDLLLTDLYIPRIPFNCNRSLTHQRRKEALGFMAEVHETARMLKQGLGRLVRREGLRHRHIWLADARLNAATPAMKPLLKLLAPYRRADKESQ